MSINPTFCSVAEHSTIPPRGDFADAPTKLPLLYIALMLHGLD